MEQNMEWNMEQNMEWNMELSEIDNLNRKYELII